MKNVDEMFPARMSVYKAPPESMRAHTHTHTMTLTLKARASHPIIVPNYSLYKDILQANSASILNDLFHHDSCHCNFVT